jgi:hypothetical protein
MHIGVGHRHGIVLDGDHHWMVSRSPLRVAVVANPG